MVRSFGDCHRNRKEYVEWCHFMAPSAGPSYKHIFRDLEVWLEDDKAITDIVFILDFCEAWWNPAREGQKLTTPPTRTRRDREARRWRRAS